MKKLLIAVLAALAVNLSAADKLIGQGATFPLPLYKEWAAQYYKQTKNQVSYNGGGSGKGISAITARNGDFGGSDAALNIDELNKAGLIQFPATIGAIVLAYNIDGIKDGELRLSHEVVAGIFSGKITQWNDPKIASDNPSLKLPNSKIIPVVRSDSSGTTFNFTSYLALANKEWADNYGANKTINWGAQVSPAAGNPLVASTIKQTSGAIGYIEYAYKLSTKLNAASLQTAEGEWIKAEPENFAKAVLSSKFSADNGFNDILAFKPNAYPLVAASFILVPKETKSAKAVISFFEWAFENNTAKDAAAKLGYEPLPSATIELIKSYWAANGLK